MSSAETEPFIQAFRGYFRNMLRWDDLDRLWATIRAAETDNAWYIYAVGEQPPSQAATSGQLEDFLSELDELLHREHEEDYCGIVYADAPEAPSFIKVYDPHNLGSVCGSSSLPPPFPGWILSKLPPVDLNVAIPPPMNRRRWWQRLFA